MLIISVRASKSSGSLKKRQGREKGKKTFSKSFNCHAHPIHDLEVWQSSENFSSLHKISTHHHDHADISCSVTMRPKSIWSSISSCHGFSISRIYEEFMPWFHEFTKFSTYYHDHAAISCSVTMRPTSIWSSIWMKVIWISKLTFYFVKCEVWLSWTLSHSRGLIVRC